MKLPFAQILNNVIGHPLKTAALGLGLLCGAHAHATIVEVQTVLGNVQINLFDHDPATKATVDNFLNYVEGAEGYGNYENNVIHRVTSSSSGKLYVVQAGGYFYDGSLPLKSVKTGPKITNQPIYSNVRGTVAMAKQSSGPDTASSQWFFNLNDVNAENLDTQNGGFTVFGQVISGIDVLDAIAALNRFNMRSPLDAIPLRDYTAEDATNNVTVDDRHLVLISNILVVNADPNSAATLNPVKNTLINKKSDGSSSVGLWMLALLGLMVGLRRAKAKYIAKEC